MKCKKDNKLYPKLCLRRGQKVTITLGGEPQVYRRKEIHRDTKGLVGAIGSIDIVIHILSYHFLNILGLWTTS